MTTAARRGASSWAVYESRTVASKEMTQVSNRARFHAEGAGSLALIAGMYLVCVLAWVGSTSVDWRMMAVIGRVSFLVLSMSACAVLSFVALAASSGIILSEITNRRIDLLRVTSLSLEAVVLGKGFAVMARAVAVLALVMPIMATAELFGGVSASDVLKAVVIILSDIFVFAGIGLAISAGAKSAFTVGLRAVIFAGLWFVVTHLLVGARLAMTPALSLAASVRTTSYAASINGISYAVSPLAVWLLLAQSYLSWQLLAVSTLVNVAGGAWFIWLTPRMLAKNIKSSDAPREEPKFKAVVRVKRLSFLDSLSRKGRRRIAGWWSRLPGTLVGGQIFQSNLFAMILPVGLFIGMFPSYLGMVCGGDSYGATHDAAASAATLLCLIVTVSIAVESCLTIAREKARRTAEVLAMTPAGGPIMAIWKGEALFGSQALGVLAALAFIALRFAGDLGTRTQGAVAAADFLGVLVLAYAAGTSFSLCSRSPAAALFSLGAAFFVLRPMLVAAIENIDTLFWGYLYGSDSGIVKATALCVAITALAPILLRNCFGRAAGLILCVSLAAAMAAVQVYVRTGQVNGFAFMYAGMVGNINADEYVAPVMATWPWKAAIAAALLAGVPMRFNRQFLRIGSKR